MSHPLSLMILALLAGSPCLHAEGITGTIAGPGTVTRSASVIRGDLDRYRFKADAGTRMRVELSAEEDNAAFTLFAPGAVLVPDEGAGEVQGETLPGAGIGEDATHWEGTLPATGTYLVEVGGTRGNAAYKLTVTWK